MGYAEKEHPVKKQERILESARAALQSAMDGLDIKHINALAHNQRLDIEISQYLKNRLLKEAFKQVETIEVNTQRTGLNITLKPGTSNIGIYLLEHEAATPNFLRDYDRLHNVETFRDEDTIRVTGELKSPSKGEEFSTKYRLDFWERRVAELQEQKIRMTVPQAGRGNALE